MQVRKISGPQRACVTIHGSSHVSKAIEVITSVERRRRWSAAEKERLVAASLEPSASVSGGAREAGIHASQLYGWRRQLLRRSRPASSLAAVRIAAEAPPAGFPAPGPIRGAVRKGYRVAD